MVVVASELVEERPDQIALRDDDVALRWADVNDLLNRVVNGLGELDLGPDRRVAVFAENAVETVLAHLGGLLAGASTVPVNFHLTAEEVAYILATPAPASCSSARARRTSASRRPPPPAFRSSSGGGSGAATAPGRGRTGWRHRRRPSRHPTSSPGPT